MHQYRCSACGERQYGKVVPKDWKEEHEKSPGHIIIDIGEMS